MALEAHTKVAEGIDPRQEGTGAMTVGTLVEAFIEKHARKLKTGKAFATRLRNNVVPVIGNVRLSELHRRDVHRVLDVIQDRGSPLAASKAQQDVRTMVRWAIQRGYLDADPMLGMQAALKSKPRERFLTEEEIAKVWPALSIMAKPVELALKLALVTGQRIGEICAMTRGRARRREGRLDHPREQDKERLPAFRAADRDGARDHRRGSARRYQWPPVSHVRLGQARSRLASCAASPAGQRLGSA